MICDTKKISPIPEVPVTTGTFKTGIQIVCVCSGIGFPGGLAATNRLCMIGRAVAGQGTSFSVLHIGGSAVNINKDVKGVYEGIEFEYLPGIISRPKNFLKRKFVYFYGALLAIFRILAIRNSKHKICVYMFVGPGVLELLLSILLWLLRVPVVCEVNEWWGGDNFASRIAQWFQNGPLLYFSKGTITISRTIERRLRELCAKRNFVNEIIRVPVLVDLEKWKFATKKNQNRQNDLPYILWCGDVEGYFYDVQFMLRTLSYVLQRGYKCKLILAGQKSPHTKNKIERYLKNLGLPKNCVDLTGYVTDGCLNELMSDAVALLLPLWNNDRSQCRFPTKLGQYLASARPVVTSNVGDTGELLTDGLSGYICPPGDELAFAEKICQVLNEPQKALAVGQNGRKQALKWLDYRKYGQPLARFFGEICVPE